MIVVCSWCDTVQGTKPGPENLITHGLCDECFERVTGHKPTKKTEETTHGIEEEDGRGGGAAR